MVKRMSRLWGESGLTLVEMMVALAVLAAVLTISVPSFARMRASYQLQSSAHRLVSAIQLARAEALQRALTIALCPSAGGDACSGSYRDGWSLFVDVDRDGLLSPGIDELIFHAPGFPADYRVMDRGGSRLATQSISYRPDGSTGSNRTLQVCAPAGRGLDSYSIVLSMVGRARVARGEGLCPVE